MVRLGQPLFAALALASVVVASVMSGCGNSNNGGTGGDNSSSGGSSSGDDSGGFITPGGSSSGSGSSSGFFGGGDSGAATPTCNGSTGWKCAVDTACPTSSKTTLTGKVFDPAGANPIYNVIVFVPNVVADLPIITPGTHGVCNACDASIGDYVVATKTDADGAFTLAGVPTGNKVPVTVQIGKWRRTTTVNIPTSCATTKVADGTLHLPGKRADGDMPQMALLTGGCDDLGCFLTDIGVDPTEFSAPQGGGRLDVYQGGGLAGNGASLSTGTAGNCTTSSCPLWASNTSFNYYDLALFSCECGENTQTKPAASMTYLRNWLDNGGKVFASHYHYTWFKNNPSADFQNIATWVTSGAATGGAPPGPPLVGDINAVSTFPKGQIFGQWLSNVNALVSAGPPPTIDLTVVATSVSTVNATTTQQWIYDPSTTPNDTKYLSFDTPIGGIPPAADAGPEMSGKAYCGKAVFTDLHTGGNLLSTVASVPSGCMKKTLSAQQKALEFLFFDLSACVSDDTMPPPPPPNQPQ